MTPADDTRLGALGDRLTRLEDDGSVSETLYRYAHSNDYGLAEEFAACFTDDGVWDRRRPDVIGEAPLRGHAAFVAFVEQRVARQQSITKHFVVDQTVSVSGDTATAESYFGLLDQSVSGEAYVRSLGRYRDRLAKGNDGRWLIEERITEREASSQK